MLAVEEVHPGHEAARALAQNGLGLEPRQPQLVEQQPRPRLPRRLAATVGQAHHLLGGGTTTPQRGHAQSLAKVLGRHDPAPEGGVGGHETSTKTAGGGRLRHGRRRPDHREAVGVHDQRRRHRRPDPKPPVGAGLAGPDPHQLDRPEVAFEHRQGVNDHSAQMARRVTGGARRDGPDLQQVPSHRAGRPVPGAVDIDPRTHPHELAGAHQCGQPVMIHPQLTRLPGGHVARREQAQVQGVVHAAQAGARTAHRASGPVAPVDDGVDQSQGVDRVDWVDRGVRVSGRRA